MLSFEAKPGWWSAAARTYFDYKKDYLQEAFTR
jgi:hypothetical protein